MKKCILAYKIMIVIIIIMMAAIINVIVTKHFTIRKAINQNKSKINAPIGAYHYTPNEYWEAVSGNIK